MIAQQRPYLRALTRMHTIMSIARGWRVEPELQVSGGLGRDNTDSIRFFSPAL